MKTNVVVAISASFLAASFLGHYLEESGRSRVPIALARGGDFATIRPQQRSKRLWKKKPDRLIWKCTAPDLVGPLSVKVRRDGSVFVMDYGDMSVKVISSSGALLGKLTPASVFKSITDIGFCDTGETCVADDSRKLVSIFSSDRKLSRSIQSTASPYRLICRRDNFLVMTNGDTDGAFAHLNVEGAMEDNFGHLLANQKANYLALDGWIQEASDLGFIYASMYTGTFARYDRVSRPVYLRASLNVGNPPTLVREKSGRMWVDREALRRILGLSVDQEGVHLLTAFSIGLLKFGVIDSYDAADGNYLFSRRIPEPCRQVVVRKPFIFTVADKSVAKWIVDG